MEAGAFFPRHATFPLSCGVSERRLRRSPLTSLFQVGSLERREDVLRVLRRLAAAASGEAGAGAVGLAGTVTSRQGHDAGGDALASRFDRAWPAFDKTVRGCRQRLARRRLLHMAAWILPLVLAAAAFVLLWRSPCALRLTNEARANCRWEAFLQEAQDLSRNVLLLRQISRRPFVLLQLAPGSTHVRAGARRSGDDAVIARPDDEIVAGTVRARVLAIFAASTAERDPSGRYASKVAVEVTRPGPAGNGGTAEQRTVHVVNLDEPFTADGAPLFTVTLVETLSDDQLCEKARRISKAIRRDRAAPDAARHTAELIADHLLGFDGFTPEAVGSRVEPDISRCLAVDAAPPLAAGGLARP
jgi:hypothetical protein